MDAAQAVRVAIPEFGKVFSQVRDVRLEEVVLSGDEQAWTVTVSYEDPFPVEVSEPSPGSLAALLYPKGRDSRRYKTISVKDQNGKVLGISNPK